MNPRYIPLTEVYATRSVTIAQSVRWHFYDGLSSSLRRLFLWKTSIELSTVCDQDGKVQVKRLCFIVCGGVRGDCCSFAARFCSSIEKRLCSGYFRRAVTEKSGNEAIGQRERRWTS